MENDEIRTQLLAILNNQGIMIAALATLSQEPMRTALLDQAKDVLELVESRQKD